LPTIVQKIEGDDTALPLAERNAKHVLEGLGFGVRKVPTTSERTPDFEVEGDASGYLVEVKSRLLDERLSKPTAPIGPPVEKAMRHDAKVGDWLADAKQQFRTLDPQHERLWFLWCSMDARFGGKNQGERTISVLYGVRQAHDIEPPRRIVVVFYAIPAAFDRFPEIDGAVVVQPRESRITFCPNEASPRFARVMASRLVRELRQKGVVSMLPVERAAAMNGYVVPPAVRRADHVAVLRDVQRATGLPYLNFMAIEVEYMQTGRIALPTEE
jgi:hypothetical protein